MLVHDDLLATGGTARALCDLVERAGAEVVGCAFVVELAFLDGPRAARGLRRAVAGPLRGGVTRASASAHGRGRAGRGLGARVRPAPPAALVAAGAARRGGDRRRLDQGAAHAAGQDRPRRLHARRVRAAADAIVWRQEVEESPFEAILDEAVTTIALEPAGDARTRVELTVRAGAARALPLRRLHAAPRDPAAARRGARRDRAGGRRVTGSPERAHALGRLGRAAGRRVVPEAGLRMLTAELGLSGARDAAGRRWPRSGSRTRGCRTTPRARRSPTRRRRRPRRRLARGAHPALGRALVSGPDPPARRATLSVAPDAVVSPATHDEVAAVLEVCADAGVAVVPFGGGTSVVGGVEPLRDGFDVGDRARPAPARRRVGRPAAR